MRARVCMVVVCVGALLCACGGAVSSGVRPAAPPGGRLSRALVRSTIREHVPEVRACYEEGLARDASLRGRVELELRIAADGSVGYAEIGGSFDAAVRRCIVDRARAWRFPAPEGGGEVGARYPFELDSSGPSIDGESDADPP